MKTYTENQLRVKVVNEVAAAMATPSYEAMFTSAIKTFLRNKGVDVDTGHIGIDIENMMAYLKGTQ